MCYYYFFLSGFSYSFILRLCPVLSSLNWREQEDCSRDGGGGGLSYIQRCVGYNDSCCCLEEEVVVLIVMELHSLGKLLWIVSCGMVGNCGVNCSELALYVGSLAGGKHGVS